MKIYGNLMLSVFLFVACSINVLAAPKVMPDGQTFDPEYYAQKNPDVVQVFGTDENKLYEHYKQYGIKEGRLPYEMAKTTAASSNVSIDGMVDVSGILGIPKRQGLDIVGWGATDDLDERLKPKSYSIGQSFCNLYIGSAQVVRAIEFTAQANKKYRVGDIYIGIGIADARNILASQGWTYEKIGDALSAIEPGYDKFIKGTKEIVLQYPYQNECVDKIWYGDNSIEF